jgi:hypothetical protein
MVVMLLLINLLDEHSIITLLRLNILKSLRLFFSGSMEVLTSISSSGISFPVPCFFFSDLIQHSFVLFKQVEVSEFLLLPRFLFVLLFS